jgi:CYTH domain-containing protein
MAEEIERKFLVAGDEWRRLAVSSQMLRQGYLSTVKERTVRVRIVDDEGFLTVKGITVGTTRAEFEYPIPGDDAAAMLDDLCERPLVEKTRHIVEHEGLTWEVDEFAGVNEGLIVAEVELERSDQEVPLPPWIGAEVTDDPRYFNANLIAHPYSEW